MPNWGFRVKWKNSQSAEYLPTVEERIKSKIKSAIGREHTEHYIQIDQTAQGGVEFDVTIGHDDKELFGKMNVAELKRRLNFHEFT